MNSKTICKITHPRIAGETKCRVCGQRYAELEEE